MISLSPSLWLPLALTKAEILATRSVSVTDPRPGPEPSACAGSRGGEGGVGLADKIHLEFLKVVVWGFSLPQSVSDERRKLEREKEPKRAQRKELEEN